MTSNIADLLPQLPEYLNIHVCHYAQPGYCSAFHLFSVSVCVCACVCVHMYFSVGAEMPLCGECMCTSVIVILVFCAIPQALPIFFFLFLDSVSP